MTGYKNYRPVHEHMADVTAFHRRNGRMPKGGKMVSAEERSAHRSLIAIRRTPGIPSHWLPATADAFASTLDELAAWVTAHNGLFPRNRPGTNEGRLRSWLERHRQTEKLAAERRQLLDERIPGWDAETLNVGTVAAFRPPFVAA